MAGKLFEHDGIILDEMMSHPALFSHENPQKIAILGDDKASVLRQALHHQTVTDIYQIGKRTPLKDERVHFKGPDWIDKSDGSMLDIIISMTDVPSTNFIRLFDLLCTNGILVQLAGSPFKLLFLKKLHKQLKTCGFSDIQLLNFPQPHFETGWRSAMIAIKQGTVGRVREKEIYNKTFSTHYYNYDMHKASLVLPEFMRAELVF